MNHMPSPREVERAAEWLEARARRSCDYPRSTAWIGRDREELHVLLTFVAIVAYAQRKAS